MSFVEELKRRNVIRVGIAYIVGAWLLAQAADLVLDVLGAPDIVLRSLVAILALGFLPAVIFAWAFEITPEGVKKESEVDRNRSIAGETGKKLNMVTIVMVIAAVGIVIVDRFLPGNESEGRLQPTSEQTQLSPVESSPIEAAPADQSDTPLSGSDISQQSVAVLPFANRSNQSDDLFFTDGIHDDLLTQLAKIHGLRVISRTSVMEYRDTTKNLKEIGAELSVAAIVEGGIQKVGNRVRVNAQLIDVATDQHLWAESFDRELTTENIFDIQSEIARQIANAISVELTPEEEQRLAEIPTQNLAAYEAYLRAKDVYSGANYSRTRETRALPWIQQAIALDPNYVEAYTLLSEIYGQQFWRGMDTSDAFLAEYRAMLDKARELNPQSPSALRAMANYHYRVENNYRKALGLLTQALEQAPGNVDVYGALGLTLRRLGKFRESIASFQRALELDPANRFYRALMLETMETAHDYQGVINHSLPLEDADPKDLDIQLLRAKAQFSLTGDLVPMDRTLEKMELDPSSNYISLSARRFWLRRDLDATIATLNNEVWKEGIKQPDVRIYRLYELANAWRLKGETEKAAEYFEAAVAERNSLMDSALQIQAFAGMHVALSLARLGRNEEALELANQLVTDTPLERDAMLTGWLLTQQAMVIGLAGKEEEAIDQLETSIDIPTSLGINAWDLRLDPNWDFLRDNPRFVALATPESIVRSE